VASLHQLLRRRHRRSNAGPCGVPDQQHPRGVTAELADVGVDPCDRCCDIVVVIGEADRWVGRGGGQPIVDRDQQPALRVVEGCPLAASLSLSPRRHPPPHPDRDRGIAAVLDGMNVDGRQRWIANRDRRVLDVVDCRCDTGADHRRDGGRGGRDGRRGTAGCPVTVVAGMDPRPPPNQWRRRPALERYAPLRATRQTSAGGTVSPLDPAGRV